MSDAEKMSAFAGTDDVVSALDSFVNSSDSGTDTPIAADSGSGTKQSYLQFIRQKFNNKLTESERIFDEWQKDYAENCELNDVTMEVTFYPSRDKQNDDVDSDIEDIDLNHCVVEVHSAIEVAAGVAQQLNVSTASDVSLVKVDNFVELLPCNQLGVHDDGEGIIEDGGYLPSGLNLSTEACAADEMYLDFDSLPLPLLGMTESVAASVGDVLTAPPPPPTSAAKISADDEQLNKEFNDPTPREVYKKGSSADNEHMRLLSDFLQDLAVDSDSSRDANKKEVSLAVADGVEQNEHVHDHAAHIDIETLTFSDDDSETAAAADQDEEVDILQALQDLQSRSARFRGINPMELLHESPLIETSIDYNDPSQTRSYEDVLAFSDDEYINE